MSTTRTWKCPQCGLALEISYDWLAEHGGPVCQRCDGDMELQPADDHAADVERLTDKADTAGLEPEDMDETVHDFAASFAADVNNGGLEGQIAYLVDGMGVQQTEKQLDELIERRRERHKSRCTSLRTGEGQNGNREE
jgi:hypothetical protein